MSNPPQVISYQNHCTALKSIFVCEITILPSTAASWKTCNAFATFSSEAANVTTTLQYKNTNSRERPSTILTHDLEPLEARSLRSLPPLLLTTPEGRPELSTIATSQPSLKAQHPPFRTMAFVLRSGSILQRAAVHDPETGAWATSFNLTLPWPPNIRPVNYSKKDLKCYRRFPKLFGERKLAQNYPLQPFRFFELSGTARRWTIATMDSRSPRRRWRRCIPISREWG